MPAVSDHRQLSSLLSNTGAFQDQNDINEILYELQSATGSQRVDLGVKKVLSALEGAVTAADGGSLNSIFAARLAELINSNSPM